MAWNGSGVFSVPADSNYPAVAGTTIRAAQLNAIVGTLVTGLNNVLCKDGQVPATANLPMGGFRHTGAHDAVSRSDYATYGQVVDAMQIAKFNSADDTGGTVNMFVVNPSPAYTAYSNYMSITFRAGTTNTGACMINVNGLGWVYITFADGSALLPGAIVAGELVELVMWGGAFALINSRYGYYSTYAANSVTVNAADNSTAIATTAFVRSYLPVGSIILWYGSVGSIPAGWRLCDGGNGTPNLSNRMVVSQGSLFGVGATGGLFDSTLPSHTHNISIGDPGHGHSLNGDRIWGQARSGSGTLSAGFVGGSPVSYIDGINNNTTGISASADWQGVSPSWNNMPPYYALCYIMKVAYL